MEYVEVSTEPIVAHASVRDYAVAQNEDALVVAVWLEPLFTRTQRQEVMQSIAESLYQTTQKPTYVCADMDVFRSLQQGMDAQVAQSLLLLRGTDVVAGV